MANILLIGGSGFVSGTLARQALADGHQVWAVARGQHSAVDGVVPLIADRQDTAAFSKAIAQAGIQWDLAVDCIAFAPKDIQQDVQVLRSLVKQLVFVSTDFVYDPAHRRFPQDEETEWYMTSGYGGLKRQSELTLINADCGSMQWTIVRPCHIYGPSSLLGCLPAHSRDTNLIARLKAGEALQLVGNGHFLQQPLLAQDLAETILSMRNNPATFGQVFCVTGPDTIEAREYYRIIAEILGVDLTTVELSIEAYRKEKPDSAPFLCHRLYDMAKLRASGASVPQTPLGQGLREHVESLS